uniref:TYRO protein tyrosine kinase-binding protein n=1 Tax=Oryzias sinensis TaxID=183150 RepID=A0A8C7Y9C5_9TELE
MKTMPEHLCVAGSFFGSEEQPGCDGCYLISMTSLIAVITSDIILTIFIMISVFCFATHQRRRRECDSLRGKKNSSLSASKKVPTEAAESPYQELHGVQSDVYSELQHIRK